MKNHWFHGRIILAAAEIKVTAGDGGTWLIKVPKLKLTLVITRELLELIGPDLSPADLVTFFRRQPVYISPKPENFHRLDLTPVKSPSVNNQLSPEVRLIQFAPWALR